MSRGVREAAMQGSKEAGKFGAFLSSFRALFRRVFSTAGKLAKARADGKLVRDWQNLMDDLLGIDTQTRYESGVMKEASDWVDPDSVTYTPPADGDSLSLGKRDRGAQNLTHEQEEAIRTGIAAAQGAIANARSNGGRSPGERQETLAYDRIASVETALVAAGLKPVSHEAWAFYQDEAIIFIAEIKQAFPNLEC